MSAALDTQGENNVTPLRKPAGLGRRKAAIALIMLGNDMAGEILRELSDTEVESLLKTAADLKNIGTEEATLILEEFVGYFEGSMLVPRADEFVKNVAEEAFGAERVRTMMGVEEPEDKDGALGDVMDAGAESLANVLKKEHPQTVAVALAVMPNAKAAEVLSFLPADTQSEVVRRVAQIKSVTPALMREIGETLRRELDSSVGAAMPVDGQHLVVNLLKSLSAEQEESIFAGLTEADPNLSEAIRKKMFVFEDLCALDPRALQMMLKEIDGRTLTLSLKTASTALREHILSSMSSRAATMILEDLEALGPVSVSQVEGSQDEIIQVALRLASEGKITLR